MKQHILQLPAQYTQSFIYLDCGARGESSKPLLKAFSEPWYIGFEPDEGECKKLSQQVKKGISFFPVAVGRKAGSASLYITRNPSCSSIFMPNREFFEKFFECGPFFDILSTEDVQLVALDDYLPKQGVFDIDFLELDTQGSELDILVGAKKLLSSSVIGIRVEVEFSEMYRNQPLFGDIDTFLRKQGFILFDLDRYRLRRKSCPLNIQSHEQIIWGQALYLRDYNTLFARDHVEKAKLIKLAIVASFYGFHSYAMEIIDFLFGQDQVLSTQEKVKIVSAYNQYVNSLGNRWLVNLMFYLNHSFMKALFHKFGSIILKLEESYLFVTKKQRYFWKD